MKKILKRTSFLIFLYFSINWFTAYIPFLLHRSIGNQINFINHQLLNRQDSVLQDQYPEGLIFSNVIFALSIINYSKSVKNGEKNAKIVDRIIEIMLSDQGNQPFPIDTDLKYGAFYNGWCNFVLKQYRNSSLFKYSEIQDFVYQKHEYLSNRIINVQKDSIKVLDSYRGASWPADNIVCIASLPDQYFDIQQKWIQKLEKNSTSKLNLINHYNGDGDTDEARGSSQALILYFLHQIQNEEVTKMNPVFHKSYIEEHLGIQFVKEHFDKNENGADIDSGPIVFGYGSVATIVNTKYQASLKNTKSKNTWAMLNFIGMPINLFGKKYYLFKQQLMYDVFMLWTAVEIEKI